MERRLTSSQARNLAAKLWGDVNSSYRVNRKGVYYFSCAGHGGYVVDPRALSPKEFEALKEVAFPGSANCWIWTWTEEWSGKTKSRMRDDIPSPFGRRPSSVRVGSNAIKDEINVLFFEEDCAWASLEYICEDIRISGRVFDGSDAEYKEKLREEHENNLQNSRKFSKEGQAA